MSEKKDEAFELFIKDPNKKVLKDCSVEADNHRVVKIRKNNIEPIKAGYSLLYYNHKSNPENHQKKTPAFIEIRHCRVYAKNDENLFDVSILNKKSKKVDFIPLETLEVLTEKKSEYILRIAVMRKEFLKRAPGEVQIQSDNFILEPLQDSHHNREEYGIVDGDEHCYYFKLTRKDEMNQNESHFELVYVIEKEILGSHEVAVEYFSLKEWINDHKELEVDLKTIKEQEDEQKTSRLIKCCIYFIIASILPIYILNTKLFEDADWMTLVLLWIGSFSVLFSSIKYSTENFHKLTKPKFWEGVWDFTKSNTTVRVGVLLGVIFLSGTVTTRLDPEHEIRQATIFLIETIDGLSQFVIPLTLLFLLNDKYHIWFKKKPKKGKQEVALIVSTTDETKFAVEEFIDQDQGIESDQVAIVMVKLPSTITSDLSDVYGILKDGIQEVKSYSPEVVHLFYRGNVALGIHIGALFSNNMRVINYHFNNSSYESYGEIKSGIHEIN